ncbi:hypothetical protein D3C75_779380 [compost metagenome]
MRGIMELIVGHAVPRSRQMDTGIVRLVVEGEVMDMGIFHKVISRLKGGFVAACYSNGRSPDVMDVGIGHAVVGAGSTAEIIVVEPALGIQQHTAVGKIADFAMVQQHVGTAHKNGCRIPSVLQNHVFDGNVGSIQGIDHRGLESGYSYFRIASFE